MRKIQSFVRRSGRLTLGQKRGLTTLWGNYGVDIADAVLDFPTVFGNAQPVILEIGFGNGDSLLQTAIDQPHINFLGVEVYEAGVGRLISQIHKYRLTNLKVIKADAMEVLKNNIATDSLSGLQLFFPDPWQKKKHHKRRLVNPAFLYLISQKLKQGASLHMATDWQNYAEQMMATLSACSHFKNMARRHQYTPRPKHRPITKFEKRAERLGHDIWDLVFIRI